MFHIPFVHLDHGGSEAATDSDKKAWTVVRPCGWVYPDLLLVLSRLLPHV